jgi:hypothetical protein
MKETIDLEFISPLFSRGMYEERPEIRAPSIRGQLHWWMRALDADYVEERRVFGGVRVKQPDLPDAASRLVVRVGALPGPDTARDFATLPHKQGGPAAPKKAFPPGTTCSLHLSERLGGFARDEDRFYAALESWLLMGTLGLRGTRGAGSFAWSVPSGSRLPAAPGDRAAYLGRCRELAAGSSLRVGLSGEFYDTEESARKVLSDSLGGHQDPPGQNDLKSLRYPLGAIRPQRKTSPLRFRLVRFPKGIRVLVAWDGREKVTGNRPTDLAGVIKLLQRNRKPMGDLLASSEIA